MSTNDVPGYKKENMDVLANGCWAEHEDGSLILVEGVEGGKVVYSIFDMAPEPPLEYRDTMAEHDFKRQFSWQPGVKTVPSNIKWTWHDKTPFPWDRIIDDFSGQKDVHAVETMTAAQRVADSLKLRADKVTAERANFQRPARKIMDRLKSAVDAFTK